MKRCHAILFTCLTIFLVTGCSEKGKENALQETIDYGTGKTQVNAYQRLKSQIHAIKEQKAKEADY